MAEQNPLEELRGLMPLLEKKLLSADFHNLRVSIGVAEKNRGNGDLDFHLLYLEQTMYGEHYYQNNPESYELFNRSISLLTKIRDNGHALPI